MLKRIHSILNLVVITAIATGPLSFFCNGAPTGGSGMVLRVRLGDGSMEKVLVPDGKEESTLLSDILDPFEIEEGANVQIGSKTVSEMSSPIAALDIRHGSVITIKSATPTKVTESSFSQLIKPSKETTWSPFPDLAKDYQQALLRTKTRRSSSKGMSYGDIARVQAALHVVEPQAEGALKRVYMCRNAAERFQLNGFPAKKGADSKASPRVGLLLGTIQKERVDTSPRKARTSLSSQTADSQLCTVAKVHALWEPTSQKSVGVYSSEVAQNLLASNPRVLKIAEDLGLVPVGWIFSYCDGRSSNEDSLPVSCLDVSAGGNLQIENMKPTPDGTKAMEDDKRESGKKFVTLAMDANTGATEAFQLSDVSVQMVHEEMFTDSAPKASQLTINTKHPVLVDGKETTTFESMLCLINTAMLSHVGLYSGGSATASTKRNGTLSNKTKKKLVQLVDDGDDRPLFEALCNFHTLLALDGLLSTTEMTTLCQSIRKWARGQKQGAKVDSKIKKKMKTLLQK